MDAKRAPSAEKKDRSQRLAEQDEEKPFWNDPGDLFEHLKSFLRPRLRN
jgi:hypothetical protein